MILRKMMQQCVKHLITNNQNSALLLIDIGVWPFNDILIDYPERVKNIGIFEPGTISLAAGLSLKGIVPTVYGISPFIVERSLEQIKLDFVYQKTGGNLITTGGSYEFSSLGYSHYCPEDVSILHQFPDVDILTPATPNQFKCLWDECCENNRLSYFRLTDYKCELDVPVEYGKATVVKKGSSGLVICAAEMLDETYKACKDLDVTILFYATIQPFDFETLIKNFNENIVVCEPFYKGTIGQIILDALEGKKYRIKSIGVPREVIRNYGTKKQKDVFYGLVSEDILKEIKNFLNEGV